uniref:Zonadhesin-like n=1 Tax=Saccoglossus kowalevskii TaxID=10224 RepID=A0ABM0MZC4_SACKO|nr:PREDICTED: zonadhesin-like [Saccoglossus kowalevskii]
MPVEMVRKRGKLGDKHQEGGVGYIVIEDDNCSVYVAGVLKWGECKDDRYIDFDAEGFEEGCFYPDKPCLSHKHCEGHMQCYLKFDAYPRLDKPCLDIGGHCVKPGSRIDGIFYKGYCPCDYDCYVRIQDSGCTGTDHCQTPNLPCGGTLNHNLCGVSLACCVSNEDDTKCTDAPYWGKCDDITKTPCENGDYRHGNPKLCSGPVHRQCCIDGCVDYLEVDDKEVLTQCHVYGGCCRPFCEPPEVETEEYSCEITNRDGNIIGTHCKCCIIPGGEPVIGVRGDPHFITLDSQKYNFNGHCSYVLLRECTNPLGTPRFTVTTKHSLMESLRRNLKPYVDSTSVIVGAFRADLLHGNLVSINNEPAVHIHELRGWNKTDKGITVTPDKGMVKVDVEGEFTVWFNGNGRVNVAIDRQYHGKVCGLLGNANDNSDDDFQKLTTNGLELVTDIDEFANSWVVPNSCP